MMKNNAIAWVKYLIYFSNYQFCWFIDVDDIDYTCNVPVCPYPCTCFNGVVDCKDKDLIEIPRNIPDNTIEL
jgi:hypothetical protein